MHFILYFGQGEDFLMEGSTLRAREYSVLTEDFRHAFEQVGTVDLIRKPRLQVDTIFDQCRARGEGCAFVSFAPPHKVPLGLRCPTTVAFAWGYSSIPAIARSKSSANNWRLPLETCGRAITLSGYAARTVRAAMGKDFPVTAILPPVWNRFAGIPARVSAESCTKPAELRIRGLVVDSRTMGLSADLLISPLRPQEPPEPSPFMRKLHNAMWEVNISRHKLVSNVSQKWRRMTASAAGSETPLKLDGVVYAAIFNPKDETKNWKDLITGFCWAFRDAPDATLVLKMEHDDFDAYRHELMALLSRLAPFEARVVVIQADIDNDTYMQLIAATSFYVNASECEAFCFPMMEFMACGTPAIAPHHTAMEDFIDSDTAFVVQSSPQLSRWAHDRRRMLRTQSYRINWETLLGAYRESYIVAKTKPERYAEMSRAAGHRIRQIASSDAIAAKLSAFFPLQEFSGEIGMKLAEKAAT